MEFEFNFGNQTIAHPEPQDMTLYASVEGIALPLSEEELVFLQSDTGLNHMMSMQVLQAMSLTQVFQPMHQHIAAIEHAIPQLRGQRQAIEKVLSFMKNKGLLRSADEWLETLKSSQHNSDSKYGGMVVRTCHRPDQLSRLLESVEQYQSLHDLKEEVSVFDDSSDDKAQKENERICQQSPLKVTYYGQSWQQQFVAMLIEEFPQYQQEIRWLLSAREGFTGGRVWNLALLALAGKKFSFFDDDFLIQPRIKSDSSLNDIELLTKGELGVGFGLNVREIKSNSEVYSDDMLSQLKEACGMSLGAWLTVHPEISASSLAGVKLRDLIRLGPKTRIKCTNNGTWGSPRAESNYWLYQLKGEQRHAFWQDRETYLDNIEASHLLHYPSQYQALTLGYFAPSMIDNGQMTPFAMPINKNEDHFFNSAVAGCYPDDVVLHFPMMMGHLQDSKRDRSSTNHIAQRPNFNRFLGDYVQSVAGRLLSKEPAARLKAFSALVEDLATTDDQSLENCLREYMTKIRSDLVNQLQAILAEEPEAPIYWQADVRELLQTNGKAVKENEVPVLNGWPEDMDIQACLAKARFDLQEVASAMRVWPELWQFCQTQ